ncbi:MAG: DUF523 domain-containing protein [candidate division Zixibacteria bacterium]|nr:DUF523 domain-containing protein [candidate division Zixibacteria bacterium]
MNETQIIIGVSSCLLGEVVRYDGGNSRNEWVLGLRENGFTLLPVCAELELGMPVPREKICLVGDAGNPKLIGEDTGRDWTDEMIAFAHKRLGRADMSRMSGFILKDKSPSCGIDNVMRFSSLGEVPAQDGTGLFARILLQLYPNLPVLDSRLIDDEREREEFVKGVLQYSHG